MTELPKVAEPPKALETPKTREAPSFIRWLNGIGAVAIGLGIAIISTYFSWGVGFMYAGGFLLLIDVLTNPALKGYPTLQLCIFGVLVILLLFFSFGIVLAPAPLEINAYSFSGDYPQGTVVGIIPWNATAFGDARVSFQNTSDATYQDVNFKILFEGAAVLRESIVHYFPNCSLHFDGDAFQEVTSRNRCENGSTL